MATQTQTLQPVSLRAGDPEKTAPVQQEKQPQQQSKPAEAAKLNPSLENEAINAQVVDDLLTHWAAQEDQPPLIAYPREDGSDAKDFELFTPKQLDVFTDGAVKTLVREGLEPVQGKESKVVAMLGQSGLDYMINMFALTRLGYTVFLLSPRLALEAYTALLNTTKCGTVVFATELKDTAEAIRLDESSSPRLLPMISRTQFDFPTFQDGARFTLNGDKAAQSAKVAFILHSSGSTGLPKPVYQTHRACLAGWTYGQGFPALLTVPLFHMFGYTNLFRAITKRCILHFFNANPQATHRLIDAIYAAKPIVLQAVPYTLQLLAETEAGMAAIRTLKFVSSAGSAVPDELGDKLVANGVLVISSWGSTEVGALMMSLIGKDWAYLRFMPFAAPHVWMKPLGDGTYELVALESLPSRNTSNSNDPPNSFHTRDFFAPHPTEKDAWKYLGRLDDRVTLVNGEKVLPLLIEGRLRQDPLIREAVVFGVGRPLPGALLFRSEAAASLDDDAFLDAVWPSITAANASAEKFSQLSRATLIPLSATTPYPHTDKGTFIRPQVYKAFARPIDAMYTALDSSAEGSLRLESPAALEAFIVATARDQLGVDLADGATDFFAAGVDSIVAINLASSLRKSLFLNGHGASLGATAVFETGTAARLAQRLWALQSGEAPPSPSSDEDELQAMRDLIAKYSAFDAPPPPMKKSSSLDRVVGLLRRVAPSFRRRSPSPTKAPRGRVVLLTGATSFLGAHILAALMAGPDPVARVYCLVRAASPTAAEQRVSAALAEYALPPIPASSRTNTKIIALPTDLTSPTLGLPPTTLSTLRSSLTHIIHAAWAVHFTLPVRAFTPHVAGLHHLLALALSAPHPPRTLFLSSISAAAGQAHGVVPEAPPALPHALLGYGRSKAVAEHIVDAAARARPGLDARVLRVGQVTGARATGRWNDREAVPLMVRAAWAQGVNALPMLEGEAGVCDWLPVDYVAGVVREMVVEQDDGVEGKDGGKRRTSGGSGDTEPPSPSSPTATTSSSTTSSGTPSASFYNITNPRTFPWTTGFLPALRAAGVAFEELPPREWLARVRAQGDPERNPSVKLVGFWEGVWGVGDSEGVKGEGERGKEEDKGGRLTWDTTRAKQASRLMREEEVDVLASGLVGRMVERWRGEWGVEAEGQK